MIRFFIDECLTPDLVGLAQSRGFEATHVTFLGRNGRPDWYLVPLAIAGDYIFVTNNAKDFRRIYLKLEVHPGLIVILPKALKAGQETLFDSVLAYLKELPDLVNKILEIDADGRIAVRDWAASPD